MIVLFDQDDRLSKKVWVKLNILLKGFYLEQTPTTPLTNTISGIPCKADVDYLEALGDKLT